MAAWKGSVEIIRKLIQHGADVNLTNKVPINETCVVCVCVCVWNEIEQMQVTPQSKKQGSNKKQKGGDGTCNEIPEF